jgi:hypothetical protein
MVSKCGSRESGTSTEYVSRNWSDGLLLAAPTIVWRGQASRVVLHGTLCRD